MNTLTDRYRKQIRGVLSCYDRMVITGTLPGVCYAAGMALFLRVRQLRLFDYPKLMEPLRERIRKNAERLAQAHGIEIEFIRKRNFRKEDRIAERVKERGGHPGLVHIFSAMESCPSFYPWHDKGSGTTSLRAKDGKCLHYYFYFLHEEFGLCYLRVPTWAPFRLQFYCNGHNWLASQLRQAGIAFRQLDNAVVECADWERAQALADAFPVPRLHQVLDELAEQFCPVLDHFGVTYHWSLMQVEYATDLVFGRPSDLRPLYESLVRTAIHSVKAEHVTTFLGRKLHPNYQGELGNDFHTRIQGTRLKHHMGPVSLKLYDKMGLVLRIETTANDVSFFKHHRQVEHRDGRKETKLATMQKTIYSLSPLRELLLAANRRYLAFLSDLTDPSPGVRQVNKLATPVRENDRSYRGFNVFDPKDLDLFIALSHGGHTIHGFKNSTLRCRLHNHTSAQISRRLQCLRKHGLIKKIARTYKYYLTRFGQAVVLTSLKLRELVVIPALAGLQPA